VTGKDEYGVYEASGKDSLGSMERTILGVMFMPGSVGEGTFLNKWKLKG